MTVRRAVPESVRRRPGLSWSLLPWRLLILTEGLFLVVTALAP